MSDTTKGSRSVLGLLVALLCAVAGCGAPLDLSAEQTGRAGASVTRSVEVIQPREENAPLRVVIDGQDTPANVMCGAPGTDGQTLCWLFAGGASFSVRDVAVNDHLGGWVLRSDVRVAAETDLQRTLAPEVVNSSLAPVVSSVVGVDFGSVAQIGIVLDGARRTKLLSEFTPLDDESKASRVLDGTNPRRNSFKSSDTDSSFMLLDERPRIEALLGYEPTSLVYFSTFGVSGGFATSSTAH